MRIKEYIRDFFKSDGYKSRGRNTMRAREQCSPESFCASGKFLRLECIFGQLPYIWESFCLIFRNVWIFFNISFRASEPSRLLGRFPKNLDWLQTNTPESFQFILSGNFTECLESFAQYGFLSGNLPYFLEDIQVVWKLSRLS